MKNKVEDIDDEFLYLQITDLITKQIQAFTLKTGDKLPSLRAFSLERGISLSTAYKAYGVLETNGLIEARPKSGYYVRYTPARNLRSSKSQQEEESEHTAAGVEHLTNDQMLALFQHSFSEAGMIKLALAAPDISLLPQAKLNKSMLEAIRLNKDSCINYDEIQGNFLLRKHIARQAITSGGNISPDDIITTQGCMEALILSLKAVTEPGDSIAIESPAYFGVFNAIMSLGLNIVEIPSDPYKGIDLNYLSRAISQQNIKACLFVPTFSNPTGFCMSNESKKELVNLLLRHKIPLIEDDIYGEMYFGKARPRTCKSYDRHGMVILCSSVSKSLAPGYRVGWCIPGKFKAKVLRLKLISTVSSATPTHGAIANFFETGRYDLHMRNLRRALHTQCLRYTQAITAYFPNDTKVSRPDGGYVLWIELSKDIDSFDLFQQAVKQHISVAPGQLFHTDRRFSNYFRISFGIPYSSQIEKSIIMLGNIIKKLSKDISVKVPALV